MNSLTPLEQRAVDAVDVDYLMSVLADLIAIPSVANAETPAQERIAAEMEALGLDTDVWDIDFDALRRNPAYTADVERHAGLGVVGTTPGASGPTLVLNGHIDVVPAGELERWTRPPYQLGEEGGRLYGRGVVDMKGSLCCALAVVRSLRDAGVALDGKVQIQSVIGEEDGGAGTLATLMRGHTGDGAIVMEPTSFTVAPAQAGALSFRITVPGRAAHGAFREEGVDPLEKFIPIFQALRRLEATRNRNVNEPLFASDELPYALTMGRLHSGIWPSTVAESLVVEGRYGIAPDEEPGSARDELQHVVRDIADDDPWLREHRPVIEWWGAQFAGARTDPADPLVGVITGAHAALNGESPRIGGVRFGADMRLLVNQGRIPTVIYGPGDVREAHRPDESVAKADLLRAAQTMAIVAMRYCGVAE